MTDSDIRIDDITGRQRYELQSGGQLAGFIDYRLQGGTIALVHTEVLPQHEGGGIGSRLARHALDEARRRGLQVVPSCSFIAAFIERHPEYRDLVAA